MYQHRPRYRAAAAVLAIGVLAGTAVVTGRPHRGSSQSAFLSQDKIVLKSARDVDLARGTVVMPIHRGVAGGKTVWYIITDASDYGIAHDLNVLYAPKLANMAINCPQCVQTAQLGKPAGKFNNDAVLTFQGSVDFSPARVYQPSATGFPPLKAAPGSVGDARYTPFVRIAGSPVVYNMPIVATGDGPFDVEHHTNTHDRVIAIDTKEDDDGPEVTMLLARGFDSGEPIVYLSTEASDAGAAAIERATYTPVLNHAPFANGDDNAGSARERIFVFANGPTDAARGQGLMFLARNGHLADDATAANVASLGSPLNVQGDFPSLDDPRHANAYSPLWDVQMGVWTKSAEAERKNVRQTDENEILNLVGANYITGPGGAPYGSVFAVNCPPIAYVENRPAADTAKNVFNR